MKRQFLITKRMVTVVHFRHEIFNMKKKMFLFKIRMKYPEMYLDAHIYTLLNDFYTLQAFFTERTPEVVYSCEMVLLTGRVISHFLTPLCGGKRCIREFKLIYAYHRLNAN